MLSKKKLACEFKNYATEKNLGGKFLCLKVIL